MTTRSELRAYTIERSSGVCEWPRCARPGEQMAHIEGIKAGGRDSADHRGNVTFLCVEHHDRLDGRRPYRPCDITAFLYFLPPRSGCRWVDCDHDQYDMQLCVTHLRLTEVDRPVPHRAKEMQRAMTWWVGELRRTVGEEMTGA